MPVGRERERLQRARPPPDLPVPRRSACPTWRSSAASAASWWSRPTPRRSRRWSTRSGRWPTSRALEEHGRARPLRLPRRARLHPARPRQRATPSSAPTWPTTSGMGLVALTNALTAPGLAAPLPRRPAGALGRAAAARADPAPAGAAGAAGRRGRRGAARARARAPGGARARHARHAGSRTSRCWATCPTPSW